MPNKLDFTNRDCGMKPKHGQMVRYNCAFYKKMDEDFVRNAKLFTEDFDICSGNGCNQ